MYCNRRDFLKLAALASLTAAWPSATLSADRFPARPVQLVVPFEAGGGSDRSFRLLAPYLQKELGVSVQVVNVAGGGGWVAWQQMARWDAKSDDHKLGVVNFPHLLSYLDPRMKRTETITSFNYLGWHSLDPCIWAIRHDETRFDGLKSLIDYVRKNPDMITVSSTGVGSDDHMGLAFAEKFLPNFKVKKLYANGDAKKIHEVISGVSDMVAGNVCAYMPYVSEKKLKFICVLHPERVAPLGEVPTFQEVTGLRNISFAGRTLVCAPGLAENKKTIYLTAIEKAMANPDYLTLEARQNNKIHFMKGEAMRKKIAETESYVKQVRYWEVDA